MSIAMGPPVSSCENYHLMVECGASRDLSRREPAQPRHLLLLYALRTIAEVSDRQTRLRYRSISFKDILHQNNL